MSVEKSNTFLVSLGMVTAALTIAIQLSSVGEIKGRIEATLLGQERRISQVETTVQEHDRLIFQHLQKPQNEAKTK